MKIGIDLIAINKSKGHGIGYFAENFCRELLSNYKDNDYFFLSWSENPIAATVFDGLDNYDERCVGESTYEDRLKASQSIKAFTEQNDIEMYIDFSPLWGERPLISHEWIGEKCRLAGVLFDLIPYALREDYYADNTGGFRTYLNSMFNLHQYDVLYSISESTKEDANKYAGYDSNRIKTIYCGVGVEAEPENKGEPLEMGIPLGERYFLYSSGDAPQKNLIRLLLAYSKAKSEDPSIPFMVITGFFSSQVMGRMRRILHYFNVSDSVIFTGFISNSQMSELYRSAYFALYPSIYEGFGMPIVEAWNYGIPVMTSDCSSMLEISEGATVLVDPLDVNDICNGLKRIAYMDPKERDSLIDIGTRNKDKYTWKKVVERFISSLGDITYDVMTDIESREKTKKCRLFVDKELEVWNSEHPIIKMKEEGHDIELDKHIKYFHVLDEWMTVQEYGASVKEYFINNNYHRIAVYGMGLLANHLLFDLKGDDVSVVYGIDKGASKREDVIPVFSPEDVLNEVDAIVITPVHEYEAIKNMLSNRLECPILSLKDIVGDVYNRVVVYGR